MNQFIRLLGLMLNTSVQSYEFYLEKQVRVMLKINVFAKKFGVFKIKCYLCNDI